MHELSIAQNILEIVQQHVPDDQRCDVRSIKVQVGRLSGVVPESLEFCFSTIIETTPLGEARLDIIPTPVRAHCGECATTFELEGTTFICPSCESIDLEILSGTELQVIEVELDEEKAPVP